ncbi:Hpt domain-containing protein [Psychrobacter sp. I-STPA6b]|uniref:Hpt domain-containing protein n=1 Tax=Psychrobacter sp. I-STPA6b TaxID=2585718 RepID=UPI001D0CC19A|nr:Hpt domain-containing protein [Psychrobacter sp. I-STPA6b]
MSQSNPDTNLHIDSEQFEELQDLLEDDFAELMATYMQDSLKRVEEIQTAINTGDNATGFESAHSLKGASANIGAIPLKDLCYQMQEACRDNTITQQQSLLDNIATELQLVSQEIKARLNGSV